MLIDKAIEAALVEDGHPSFLVFKKRQEIRPFRFFPLNVNQRDPLSPATIHKYVRQIAEKGTRESILL